MKLMLVSLSILLLVPNFFNIHLGEKPQYNNKELFNPKLAYINSVDKLIEVSDSTAKANNIAQGTLQYGITVSSIIRNRFYHGFSQYPLNQNWIAATGQGVIGYGLDCIVNGDEILKYSYGGCSQQCIVLMDVMRRKNISYRYVGFPHHYALELNFNNNWYFFDPNMEPNISDSARLESKWNCCADSLKKYYNRDSMDWIFGKNLKVELGQVNSVPATHVALFHGATKYLSKILWLFPIALIFYRRKKIKE